MDGDLNGNVMFAQATIIPSQPATNEEDIRPHLVSIRDTLVLFKPVDEAFLPEKGVELIVLNKEEDTVYEQSMLPPDQLPGTAGTIGNFGDEFKFLEPDSYDLVIDGIENFHEAGNILIDHTTIKVEVSDGGWAENVKLPDIDNAAETLTLVTISSISSNPFHVNYGNENEENKKTKIKANGKMIFTNLNGKWDNLYESAYLNDKIIRNYIINKKAANAFNVTKPATIKGLGNDNDGDVIIPKGDFNRPHNIYLPDNREDFHGRLIVLTSISKKETIVHYGERIVLSTNENVLIFLNLNGVWLEWADALFGAIRYGENFWSARIPKEHVLPGMSLTFKNGAAIGSISGFEVGAPTELVLHTIDIGMLTEPRGDLPFQTNLKCQAEYFQRIPVSRLIVTQYEPVHLTEVVLSDNTTYLTHSTDVADGKNGDMRGDIGKALIATGINMANYGIHSTFGPAKAKRSYKNCLNVS